MPARISAPLEVDVLRLCLVAGLVGGFWPEWRIGIILDPELNSFRDLLACDLTLRHNPASALAETPAPVTIVTSR